MKVGVHACTYLDNFNQDECFAFEKLSKMGFDLIEIPILNNYSYERAEYIKRNICKYNLDVSCCTSLPPEADMTIIDESANNNAILYLKKCIDFCRFIGANQLSGVLCEPWGKIDKELNKVQRWNNSLKPMREVANYAEKYGIKICIEVLNRYESNFLNTIEDGVSYLKLLNRKNVFLLADTFHLFIEEKNVIECIHDNIMFIGSIHISESNRGIPRVNNNFWMELIKTLNQVYKNYIIMECCETNDTEVSIAFSQWQNLLNGEDVLLKLGQSVHYLKQMIG